MSRPGLEIGIGRSGRTRSSRRGGDEALGPALVGSAHRDLAAAIAEAPSATRFDHGTWRQLRTGGDAIEGLP